MKQVYDGGEKLLHPIQDGLENLLKFGKFLAIVLGGIADVVRFFQIAANGNQEFQLLLVQRQMVLPGQLLQKYSQFLIGHGSRLLCDFLELFRYAVYDLGDRLGEGGGGRRRLRTDGKHRKIGQCGDD